MHYFDESAIYLMHALSAVKDRDRFSSSICDSNRPLSLPCRVMGILRFPEKKKTSSRIFCWTLNQRSVTFNQRIRCCYTVMFGRSSTSNSSSQFEFKLLLWGSSWALIWIFENFLVLWCSWEKNEQTMSYVRLFHVTECWNILRHLNTIIFRVENMQKLTINSGTWLGVLWARSGV